MPTSENLFNLNKRKPASLFFRGLSDGGKSYTLLWCNLIPEPIEVELTSLHDLVQHSIYIVDRDIRFTPIITVIYKSPAHQMDQIGLIRRQLPDLFNGEWLIFKVACDRFLDQIFGTL